LIQRGKSYVPELIAKTALDGRAPLTASGTTLAEADPGPVTSIALMPGGEKLAAKGLKTLGLSFPEPNCSAQKGAARIIWTGRDQAYLIGVAPPQIDGAALTDQSGGWASLTLTGPLAEGALSRYVALDLRLSAFPQGAAVRTGLYHMNAILIRTAADQITTMVFRSMARTAWHEIEVALRTVAARAA
jgi:sarcosine oxidase subunit gamma